MFSWDLTITLTIVAAAGYYVAFNIYKTIKEASAGSCGNCSACSHCKFAGQPTQSAKRTGGQFSK
jgi:hypothetical protein